MIAQLIETMKKEAKEQENSQKQKLEEDFRLEKKRLEERIQELEARPSYISSFDFLEDKEKKTLTDRVKIKFSKKYKRAAEKERRIIAIWEKKDKEEIEKIQSELIELSKELEVKLNEISSKFEAIHNSFNDYDSAIKKLLELKPNLLENEEFMLELLSIDVKYIIYDKTNSPRVYEEFIKLKIKSIEEILNEIPEYTIYNKTEYGRTIECKERNLGWSQTKDQIDDYNKLLEEIKNPRQPEPGKYKIPHKYLFESIRKREFNETSGKTDSNALVDSYLTLDCSASLEFGKMIEKLYDDENSTLYGHGIWVGTGSKMDTIKSIFYEGLQMNYDNDMTRTTISSKSSFVDLGYFLQHEHPLILLSIPNDKFEKFGCDEKQDVYNRYKSPPRTYILPEFVIGAVNGRYGLVELGTEYIKNEIPVDERKKYKYFSSSKGDYSSFEEQLSSRHR